MVPFFVVVSDIVAQEPRNSFSNRPLSRTYVSIYGQKALLRHLIRFLHLYTENIQHNKTNKKGRGKNIFRNLRPVATSDIVQAFTKTRTVIIMTDNIWSQKRDAEGKKTIPKVILG